jgi:hypothetical protein
VGIGTDIERFCSCFSNNGNFLPFRGGSKAILELNMKIPHSPMAKTGALH